jgi:dinuclear metal center YbgI/SA1388 family protein
MSEKSIQELIAKINARTPVGTAEDWDNVGLLVGDPSRKTSGAVVSIDLTRAALDAAKAKGYGLIVTHHPCIFPKSRGLSRVTAGGGMAGLVYESAAHGIAVFSTHTNFDQCALEVPQQICEALGVKPVGRLIEKGGRGSLLKLSVFVPKTHSEAVRAALCDAGAGRIGQYDSCTFGTLGQGTFRGNENSNPFLGKPGKLEIAEEIRLETLLPRGLEAPVLKALKKAHPYEEIAYDLFPVEQGPVAVGLNPGIGYGFYGDFAEPKTFPVVAQHVKALFQVDGFWVSEPVPQTIRRIGFVAGKGASFVGAAAAVGCDLFITGEAGYHTALEGSRAGVCVMELGHRESELFFVKTVARWLEEEGLRVEVTNAPTQRLGGFSQ